MSKTTRRVYKIAAAAAFTAGSVAAIPATFAAEAPADQQQQVVDQKATAQTSSLPGGNVAEAPKAEATQAPKAEAPKTEAPKAEATEAPKAETPKAEAPKAEATEAPKAETPKAETPAPTAPATEAPKAETPKAETPKAEATEAPKAETPKAETPKADASEAPKAETPAPTAPAAPEPTTPATPAPEAKQADPSVVIENAHFPGDAQFNTVSVVATGFYGEKVGPGVQVSIYALDANNQVTGDAIATVSVSADQIQDGSFKTAFTVEASKLPAGASYALVAVSNPQGQPEQKLVALSSFKVTESTSPKTETPKADETPAPEAPKTETPAPVTPAPETPKADETPAPEAPKTEAPKEETPAPEAPKTETPKADETPAPEAPAAPENATLTTEDASLDPNDQYNVLTFNGSGFTHESVANGVQIAIFRLDANGNITGDALATHDIPASEIVNGTFRVKVSVLAELLQPGYAYAMVATSDPNGLVHQVAVTTATVSDANNPAPTLPAATEDDNTTVRDNGDGTTSVFTAEMREDGSVVVTETRMPTSQAPKAKVGNASAATSSKGHGLSTSGTKGSTSTSSSASSSSKQQLAHTGAEGVAGIAGVGAAALIAGAALMLLRRRSL
ncbi:LPXTG cell wall anchor domain-containing protein [Rothia mucilaginosa]|uniref:LPXTG cell wall anchor domain-containing protein n=1 Tax=Rothia mucilaginosa TaxID=43675 RepID=UPI0026EADB57|nr:LPXTG cell wall anchor domain-containing protein [Rothia mucilaginosa]